MITQALKPATYVTIPPSGFTSNIAKESPPKKSKKHSQYFYINTNAVNPIIVITSANTFTTPHLIAETTLTFENDFCQITMEWKLMIELNHLTRATSLIIKIYQGFIFGIKPILPMSKLHIPKQTSRHNWYFYTFTEVSFISFATLIASNEIYTMCKSFIV